MKNNKEIDLLPDQPLGEKLIKKGFWLYFFAYLAAPCAYFIKLIVSNTLSVADVGILYSIIGFISILSSYNGLGLTESLNYFLPKFYIKKQRNYIKTSIFMSLGVQLITSLGIILLLFYGTDWLVLNYFHAPETAKILKYFCFYFLGINLFQVIIGIFSAFQDTFNARLLDFIKIFSILVFIVLFFLFGVGSIQLYSVAWILGMFVGLIIGIIIFTKKYRKILFKGSLTRESTFLKKYWKYSLWTFLSLNAVLMLGHIDQQMVIVILGPKAAGYYTNFVSLKQILMLLVTPIMAFLFPLFTEMIEKNETKKISSLQNILYTYISFFTIAISLFLVALGPEIAVILFGQKFVYSGQLMMLGGIFLIFNVLFYLNFQILGAMGKANIKAKIIGTAMGINIVLNFILLKSIGLWGAIIGTAVAMIVMYTRSYNIIKKIYPIHIDRKFLIKNLLLFLFLAGIIFYVKNSIFVLDDIYRYKNIGYLLIIGLSFAGTIIGVNYKKIIIMKKFVLKLKK